MGTPTEKDMEHCACSRCPTFVKGDTGRFCVHGKTQMAAEPRGCLCRTCQVHIENSLKGREYCLRGKPEA